MEIFRSLGALVEPPGAELLRVARLLDLGEPPDAAAHTELFTFQLYPYASVYLDPRGMLGGEARDRVGGFWRALGQKPPTEPDHLAVMLAFYAGLCEQSQSQDPDHLNRWDQARKAYLWEHLLSWLPVFLIKLESLAPPFYRNWSRILSEALRHEAKALGAQERLALHLRSAPPMTDPRKDGLDEFLDALLSPVRSGVIWVRADFSRAARELGLGSRAGERRFILKALLGQEHRATLGWLAQRAQHWAEELRDSNALWEASVSFWTTRAESTATLLSELSAEG